MDDSGTTPARRVNVVVIGGGNGGLSVAGRLRRAGVTDIVVVEPQTDHYYKPLFSHVAGGTARASEAVRPQADVTPRGVEWVQDAVASVLPEGPPAIRAPHRLSPAGASNYLFDLAAKASPLLRDLRAGTVAGSSSSFRTRRSSASRRSMPSSSARSPSTASRCTPRRG
ncbi:MULTISPECIES: FAD-dependent oxidoreductase [Microbacterium]|uniref:FAD-dependent oxidoreductase n=1 Tax=Microbacterium TaxID=33882 RepID=UPI0006845C6C